MGFDYCIDTAGKVETIEKSFQMLNKNKGQCIFCSHPSFDKKIQINPFELISGKKILGSWGGASKPDIDLKKYSLLMKKIKINFKKLFSKEYKLDEINTAIDDLKKGKVLRPIVVINKDI